MNLFLSQHTHTHNVNCIHSVVSCSNHAGCHIWGSTCSNYLIFHRNPWNKNISDAESNLHESPWISINFHDFPMTFSMFVASSILFWGVDRNGGPKRRLSAKLWSSAGALGIAGWVWWPRWTRRARSFTPAPKTLGALDPNKRSTLWAVWPKPLVGWWLVWGFYYPLYLGDYHHPRTGNPVLNQQKMESNRPNFHDHHHLGVSIVMEVPQ